jgi:hypothetical protein
MKKQDWLKSVRIKEEAQQNRRKEERKRARRLKQEVRLISIV